MGGDARVPAEPIEVVAGVVRDDRGRVLLTRRPEGKHLAGCWEFPGGKREAGETGPQALARELAEELGLAVTSARPWLALTHRYPEITVRLQLYTVDRWRGAARGREGQALQWVTAREMSRLPMPAADRPIVRAFDLDGRYAITPDPIDLGGGGAVLDWAQSCLRRGIRLLQLRAGSMAPTDLAELGREFGRLVAGAGARWLLDGSPELATELGADGVHLDRARLAAASARPLSGDFLVAASCRSEAELTRAGELALDFVTLSPVQAADRPDAGALGWDGFERLCRFSPLPVYARGGLSPDDLDRSRERGGFGVAGGRGFGERP